MLALLFLCNFWDLNPALPVFQTGAATAYERL